MNLDTRTATGLSHALNGYQKGSVTAAALKAGWIFVGGAFQDDHPACEGCPHRQSWDEPRPYGSGTVYESLRACALGELASHKPTDCPAYAAHLAEEAEEVAAAAEYAA